MQKHLIFVVAALLGLSSVLSQEKGGLNSAMSKPLLNSGDENLTNSLSPGETNKNCLKLWYNKPAGNWNEALPLGNGRIGAMVYGIPAIEQIQLNEETVWAGSPNNNFNPNAKEVLPIIRQMIFDGKYLEAQTLATEKIMSNTNHGMPYQSIGEMFISFPGHHGYTNFYRELDIQNAIAKTTYTVDGINYTREVLTSFTDQVVVVRLSADTPGSITCNVMLNTPQDVFNLLTEKDQVVLSGVTPSHERQSGKIRFQARLQAFPHGGKMGVKDGVISITNADEVTLKVAMATNFVNYKDISGDENAKCIDYMKLSENKGYEEMKSDHIHYFRKFMDRVSIYLGESDAVKNPTDIRIRDFATGYDPQLAALYYQFGRYLLICSSQPGTQPPTLQGIWNDRVLPPWDSKYTININTEMNYWPAEVTNLSELTAPLFSMINDLSVTGQETARIMYGARGWVAHHNTDLFRITGPVDRAPSGMWTAGGAWLCQHLWEHYLFTGNRDFLASAYPAMKGAAQFYADFLIKEPTHGWLVVSPSSSPENSHAGSNNKATTAAGCTMDNQIVFDLFSNVIHASEILARDASFADSLKDMRAKLPPMQIGKHSQLQEWMFDWDNPDDKHRHVSHLYGVYPSNQISPYRTPELFDAARTSLIYRGDPSTGWSMGWKVCLWSRFLDGDHAYKLLTDQLSLVSNEAKKGGTYANMFDAHPPFQIDGNFGCTAGMTEMFLQSHDGFIYVLPALPSVWKSGRISGLVARGGFVVDLEWDSGQLKKLVVHSTRGGNCRIRSNVSLKGEGVKLVVAKGKNSNPLFDVPEIKAPLISEKANLNKVEPAGSVMYDIATRAGKSYVLIHNK